MTFVTPARQMPCRLTACTACSAFGLPLSNQSREDFSYEALAIRTDDGSAGIDAGSMTTAPRPLPRACLQVGVDCGVRAWLHVSPTLSVNPRAGALHGATSLIGHGGSAASPLATLCVRSLPITRQGLLPRSPLLV